MRRFVIMSFLLLAFYAAPAFGQTAPAAQQLQQTPPPCNGDYTIVRLSEITPGGSMKGFLDAAKAHLAWYRSNGIKDNQIIVARVIDRDEKTGKMSYSDKEVMTYHINPPAASRTPKRGDDAWNAYVKMYRDNSDIKYEHYVCMPKH